MEMGGIAGALAKALEERRMNMALDDSSDEEGKICLYRCILFNFAVFIVV